MAIVNRMCGTKSCEMEQTMKEGKFSDWIQQQPGVKFEVLEVLVASCTLLCSTASETISAELSPGLPFGLSR